MWCFLADNYVIMVVIKHDLTVCLQLVCLMWFAQIWKLFSWLEIHFHMFSTDFDRIKGVFLPPLLTLPLHEMSYGQQEVVFMMFYFLYSHRRNITNKIWRKPNDCYDNCIDNVWFGLLCRWKSYHRSLVSDLF